MLYHHPPQPLPSREGLRCVLPLPSVGEGWGEGGLQDDKEDTMNIDQVLDEYRQGDADKRMSLFLYYRELRNAFTSIEQENESGGQCFTCLLPSRLFRPSDGAAGTGDP